jgi:hypothetical protein
VEDAPDVLLDRGVGDEERLGDAVVRLSLGHLREHVALTRRQAVQRTTAPASQHAPHHDRVERGAALGDALDRIDERRDVADALLEQVADAVRVLADQIERERLLEELRQDQDPRLVGPAAQLERRAQPVVLPARRHLHVDDRDVGPVRARLAQEVDGVARLRDDVQSRLREDPRDPRAEEDVVLADHHADRRHVLNRTPGPDRPRACR